MKGIILVPFFMTDTANDPKPTNVGEIETLYRDGKIPRAALQFLLMKYAPRNLWGRWADRVSLVVGVALLLAGVIFFFAFNWKDMPGWQKLGLINLGLVTCAACAIWRGLDHPAGQSFGVGASIFVGAFMAVFGQIYQTGADAFQLFMMWSILIFPWVVLSKSLAHWTLWTLIVVIFLYAIWVQQVGDGFEINVVVALFTLTVYGLQNALRKRKGFAWADHDWFSWIWFAVAVSTSASVIGVWAFKIRYGFDIPYDPFDGAYHHPAGILSVGIFAFGYVLAFRLFPNLVAAQIWSLVLAILLSGIFLIFFAETLFDAGELGLLSGGIFSAAIIAGIFWGGIKFLNAHRFNKASVVERTND